MGIFLQVITTYTANADTSKLQYRSIMLKLKLGDTLVIKNIDRLGRNYAEIWNSGALT